MARVTRLTEKKTFPGEVFTWRKRVTRLGEFSLETYGMNILPCPDNYMLARMTFCQQRMDVCRQGEVLHVT